MGYQRKPDHVERDTEVLLDKYGESSEAHIC